MNGSTHWLTRSGSPASSCHGSWSMATIGRCGRRSLTPFQSEMVSCWTGRAAISATRRPSSRRTSRSAAASIIALVLPDRCGPTRHPPEPSRRMRRQRSSGASVPSLGGWYIVFPHLDRHSVEGFGRRRQGVSRTKCGSTTAGRPRGTSGRRACGTPHVDATRACLIAIPVDVPGAAGRCLGASADWAGDRGRGLRSEAAAMTFRGTSASPSAARGWRLRSRPASTS